MNEKQLAQMESEMYGPGDFEVEYRSEGHGGLRVTVYRGYLDASNHSRPMFQLIDLFDDEGFPIGGPPMVFADNGDDCYAPKAVCRRCYDVTRSDCPEHPEGYTGPARNTWNTPTARELAVQSANRRPLP